MRKWITYSIVVALAAFVLGLAYVGSARSASVPNVVPVASSTGEANAAVPETEDTTSSIDQRLQADFTITTKPSTSTPAVSREDALTAAKSRFPSYAKEAASVTIRHVLFTDRNLASLSDDQLDGLGVKERPQELDCWMVTFHKVTARSHGPAGVKRTSGSENVVVMLSSSTGEVLQSNAFGPVK